MISRGRIIIGVVQLFHQHQIHHQIQLKRLVVAKRAGTKDFALQCRVDVMIPRGFFIFGAAQTTRTQTASLHQTQHQIQQKRPHVAKPAGRTDFALQCQTDVMIPRGKIIIGAAQTTRTQTASLQHQTQHQIQQKRPPVAKPAGRADFALQCRTDVMIP